MIRLSIQAVVLPQKRNEFIQTVRSLLDQVDDESGPAFLSFANDINNRNSFYIEIQSATRPELETFLKSDSFRILRGAMSILTSKDSEINIHNLEKVDSSRLMDFL